MRAARARAAAPRGRARSRRVFGRRSKRRRLPRGRARSQPLPAGKRDKVRAGAPPPRHRAARARVRAPSGIPAPDRRSSSNAPLSRANPEVIDIVRIVLRVTCRPERIGPALEAPQRFARFFGTLAPDLRACDRPIAIACLRLFTGLPERPLLSVPRLRSCIAFSTFLLAFLP